MAKIDKKRLELAFQVQLWQLLDYTKSLKMSVPKAEFIVLLFNPGITWTRSYVQMKYYLVYDPLPSRCVPW